MLNKRNIDKVKSIKDLNSPEFTVASTKQTTSEDMAKKLVPNARQLVVIGNKAGVSKVISNEADAFIYDLPFNSVVYSEIGQDKLIHLNTPINKEPYGIEIRKNNIEFRNWLRNFLSKIKENGQYDRLYSKWFN